MAGRVLLVLALLVGAVVVLFWRPARPPPPDVPRAPTAADLVVALEEGDASVLPKILALKQEGIAALEQRLAASGRGILDLAPRKDDPRDRLIAALEAFGPAAEPALVRVLKALPGKAARIAAALEAIGAKSPEAIEALLHVLQRDHEIESALSKAGSAAIAGLAEALLDEERCDGAARALAALGAKAELRAALAPDAPPKSRAAAARALGDVRDAAAKDALLAMVVEEENDEIVAAAASGLCGIGAEDALLERARALTGKGPVFDGAVERKSEAFLLRAARDEDEEMRRGAFGGFARVGRLPPEAVPLAKKALAGKAREEAAEALGNGCDDPEVPALLLALAKEDKDPYVRIRAGEAYWRLGGDAQEVIPILVAELPLKADLHHLVGSMKQNAASKALRRLGAVAVPALVEALDTDDDFARDQAATALFEIGKPVHAGEARLRELAASQSAKVSDQAKRLLEWLANLPHGPGS
jgi:HEAT repeat protein